MRQDEAAARRYARGLVECATANGTLPAALADFRRAADLLDPGSGSAYSPELAAALADPSAATGAKAAMLDAVLSGLGVGDETRGAFSALARRGKLGLAPKVALGLEEMSAQAVDGAGGVRTAIVQTARALSAEQTARLAAALEAALACPVRLRQMVEPGLLAGARVTVGEWSMDGTVAGQLDALRQRLLKVGETTDTAKDNAS